VLLSKKVYKHKFIRNFEEFKALHDGLVDFFWKVFLYCESHQFIGKCEKFIKFLLPQILIPALPKKPSFRFLKDLDCISF
jgi:hypothetical protein